MIFISLVVLFVVLYSSEYHNYQVSSKIQQYMQTDQKSTENCISKQNYFFWSDKLWMGDTAYCYQMQDLLENINVKRLTLKKNSRHKKSHENIKRKRYV